MAQPRYEQLLADNRRLVAENQPQARRIVQLQARVEQLTARVRQLAAQVQEALRASKRQAGPFSKGPPKDHPKPPGRKPGPDYGPKAQRPIPDQAPDEIIGVPLPDQCPHCGRPTAEDHTTAQYQTEIPRRAICRRFDLHVGHSTRCGRRVQGRHPLQSSDATGAAASQLGPHGQAASVRLSKHGGLSHAKIAGFFGGFFGIALSSAGACQDLLWAGCCSQSVYQAIVRCVRRFAWIVPDETGWRISGRPPWLHVFLTDLSLPGIDATHYRAEQALRPPAGNRKVCPGNRTVRKAAAQSILLSVLRTCRQQAQDSISFLAGRLCGQPLRVAYLPAAP